MRLLQQVNRDTPRFAMKCSAMEVGSQWRDVYKQPIGDSMMASKKGHFSLIDDGDRIVTRSRVADQFTDGDVLTPVFKNGRALRGTSLEEILARAAEGLGRLSAS